MTPDDLAGPDSPPAMSPELLPHASRLDEIEGWAADLEQQLAAGPATILQQQQRAADAIAGTVQGAAGSRIVTLEGLRTKLAGKMQKRAHQLFGNAWTNTVPYGAIYPSTQDALYGLQSGDSFGSMGLTQPTQQPAPAPVITTTGTPASPPPPPGPYPPPPGSAGRTPAGPLGSGSFDPGGDPGFDPLPDEPPTDPVPPWQQFPPGGGIIEDPTFPPAPNNFPGGIPVSTSCGPAMLTFAATAAVGDYFAWAAAGAGGCTLVPAVIPQYLAPPIPQGWCNLWGQDPATGGQLFGVWAPCGCTLWIPQGGGDAIVCCGPPPAGYCMVYANNQSGGVSPPGPTPPPPSGPAAEVCAAIATALCGVPAKDPPAVPQAPSDDRCGFIEFFHQMMVGNVGSLGDYFKVMSGTVPAGDTVPTMLKWLLGVNSPALPELASRLFTWAGNLNRKLSESLDCELAGTAALSTVHAMVAILDKYLPIIPPQYRELVKQALNFGCTYLLPSGSEADRAYLMAEIDQKTWECWHKAAGDLVKPAEKVMRSGREKPTAREYDLLYRRKYISQEQSATGMRRAGALDDDDAQLLRLLNDQWPGLADVIRMMVRDVADPDAVRRAGLDTDFEKKWQGKLKEFGDALGVPPDIALYYWRAHWKLPSATQLFEMLHRLRPDAADEFAGVTADDVREALKQDDMAPAWVDHLMAISYKVVTRVDARRMYTLHTIDDEQLQGYFQDEGYTERDARALVEFSREQRRVAELKASGLPSVRTMVTAYARGEAGTSDLMEVAQQLLPQPEQLDTAMQAADLARDLVNRRQQIAGIKRQYVSGLIGDDDTRQILFGIGVDPDEVEAFLFTWKILKQKKGKEPSAAMLCKWRYNGIITAAQQAAALVNVGWAPADALRIVKECEREIAEKEAKAAAKAAQDAAKAVKQAEKEAAASRKKSLDEAKEFARRNGRNGVPASAGP